MVIGAVTGWYLEKQQQEKKDKMKDIQYVANNLNQFLCEAYKNNFDDKIKELYIKDQKKFEQLNKSVEMLMNTLTVAGILMQRGDMPKKELVSDIEKYKQNIIDILGGDIKLIDPVEKFLTEDDAEK